MARVEFRPWLELNKDGRFSDGKNREELGEARFQVLFQTAKEFVNLATVTGKPSDVDPLRTALKVYDDCDKDYEEAEYKAWIASITRAQREESRLDKELLSEFDRLNATLGVASENPGQSARWGDAYDRLMAAIRADMTLLLQRETTNWLARGVAVISDEAKVSLFEELWYYCRDGADDGNVASILSFIANCCGPTLLSREKNNAYTLISGKSYSNGVHESVRSIKRARW